MKRVVHFDLPVEDVDKAKDFFNDIFGWKFTEWLNQEYWLIETGNKIKRGINGSLIKRRHPLQVPTITIKVENIDLTLKKIEEEGGQVVFPKTTIPKIGWLAYFKDPEENLLCVMQFHPSAK